MFDHYSQNVKKKRKNDAKQRKKPHSKNTKPNKSAQHKPLQKKNRAEITFEIFGDVIFYFVHVHQI